MTRFSQADRDEMCRLRESGLSLSEIAKIFGTSRQLIHIYTPPLTLDIEMEVRARRNREVLENRSDIWTPDEDLLLEQLWRQWKNGRIIADSRRLRRSYRSIWIRIDRLGLKDRFGSDRPTGSVIR